ncbi:discoidin domain-containing protein [Clostridium botulinum]|uniref:F5/8 type C domain protein n=1 Tax=Clostridium botulinum (strain Langeland / NCTC 10281 / Type F) TaxID=441772 RepID=A7GHN5_CLOBL|nr:discoidin domain-containing protein [Clostridium botulinum]ABS41377.1 F5/8 type C domain protein [Clostridium botulinum F str. Langeland]ADG00666.1 F5/8 type C domain protein [Clostridium botulinum F str. 230613]KKM40830.1 cell adhesion protein [Clostridium botulinum]MBY6792375.1 discoidin domain-containing protein [Clostridium botulinum]MBY6937983.1 discoidin domain-containing protein [Clostridium botulinum]
MATIGQQLLQPESGWKRYDDRNENINYIGNWRASMESGSLKWSGSNQISNIINDKIQFNFAGDKIRIIASTAPANSNNIEIKIDNNIIETINMKATNINYQVLVYEKTGMRNKEHFLEITNLTNDYTVLDAIDIDENGELKPYDSNISSIKKYTNNIIPLMASDEDKDIKLSCSAYYTNQNGSKLLPFLVFDNTVNTGWNFENQSQPIGGHWLKIFFKDKARCISRITIRNGVNASISVKNFKIQGSNDDNIYVDLYTGLHPFGEFNTTKASYTFKNSVKYNYYRILIIDSYYSQSTTYGGIGELEMMEILSNKYLIQQDNNYYSINNNYIDLGIINDDEELNTMIDEYGYNDLSILTKELNTKRIPVKLENDYYKSFDINLNDIKDSINLIEEDDKKHIECGCNNYKISDKVKEINNAKFKVLMKE